MAVRRLLSNISSERLQESRDFYADLLGMEVASESDWYIRLRSPSDPGLELGLIQRNHPLLPAHWRAAPVGMYLTFVQPPRDEFYGQRRFLTRDPDGTLVDISSPWRQEVLPEETPPVAIAAPEREPVARVAVRNAARRAVQRRTIDQVLRDARLPLLPAAG